MYRFLLILLTLIPALLSAANWKVTLKSVKQGPYNTFLYLQYHPGDQSNTMTRPQVVEINFRKKGTFPIVLSKEQRLEIKGAKAKVFRIELYIQPGIYEVDIDIADVLSGRHTPLAVAYRCMISPKQLSVSDIFLSYEHAENLAKIAPILDFNLAPGNQKLYFLTEIYAPYARQLSVRAILYQEVDSLSSSSVSTWLDIRKITRVVSTQTPRTVFGDNINISGLKEGSYLLQILIYDQDSLLLKPSTHFVIEGGTRQKIFDDLPTSIQMMRYILPSIELERLSGIQNKGQQETAFRQAWFQLYGEAADSRMNAYFKRVYSINERLSAEGEDWESDRGRIYLQYGEPAYTELVIHEKEYQRWTYVKWDLSFLFEKRNQGYILVE